MDATALMKKTLTIMFDAVSTDTVAALKQLLVRTNRQERAKKIADSFNSKAGRFIWKVVVYPEALPLFAAILILSLSFCSQTLLSNLPGGNYFSGSICTCCAQFTIFFSLFRSHGQQPHPYGNVPLLSLGCLRFKGAKLPHHPSKGNIHLFSM